ncbi:MAG: hypothetical protein M0R40_07210 [Firmicutes bacterium]|nr:hypothetical protein [Bacillota bacterium]
MAKRISRIFLNSMFKCDNYVCHCEKDIKNVAPGQPPKTTLKLYCDINKPLHFSYAPRVGLNLTGIAGGVIEKNILGKLLAIPNGDIDKHIEFFETYGFLLPIQSDEYDSVDADAIIEVVNRIKATLYLMNAIAGQKNYKRILIYTTYLLYMPQIILNLSEVEYSTCSHRFTELIENYNLFVDLSRNQEVFGTGKYSIPDTMVGCNNPIEIEFFNAVRSGADTDLVGSKSIWFKHLFAMYTSLPFEDEKLRTIIDFFYHYQTEIGIFNEIQFGKITYYATPTRDNFTDEMKASLLKIARIVISEEINHNIIGIYPKYETDELAPAWQVNNLIQALYFSIFYMRPGLEIYKECKKPNCKRDKFFLVEATRTNKEYCCVQCSRAAATQRYRNRQLDK